MAEWRGLGGRDLLIDARPGGSKMAIPEPAMGGLSPILARR